MQRVSALVLVVVVPLRMYTGYAFLGKVPWFKSGSAPAVHMNTALDITMLLCILLHALYGIRVMLIDVGWIREDKFFWRTTAGILKSGCATAGSFAKPSINFLYPNPP